MIWANWPTVKLSPAEVSLQSSVTTRYTGTICCSRITFDLHNIPTFFLILTDTDLQTNNFSSNILATEKKPNIFCPVEVL